MRARHSTLGMLLVTGLALLALGCDALLEEAGYDEAECDKTLTELGSYDEGPEGISANEAVIALGHPVHRALTWDDGTRTKLALELFPGDTLHVDFEPEGACPGALDALEVETFVRIWTLDGHLDGDDDVTMWITHLDEAPDLEGTFFAYLPLHHLDGTYEPRLNDGDIESRYLFLEALLDGGASSGTIHEVAVVTENPNHGTISEDRLLVATWE